LGRNLKGRILNPALVGHPWKNLFSERRNKFRAGRADGRKSLSRKRQSQGYVGNLRKSNGRIAREREEQRKRNMIAIAGGKGLRRKNMDTH